MLRSDLKRAGIAYRDEQGRYVDFHALRHTFITQLVRSGVHPAKPNELARHSTITLTMDVYSHVETDELRVVLEMLFPIDVSVRRRGTRAFIPSLHRSLIASADGQRLFHLRSRWLVRIRRFDCCPAKKLKALSPRLALPSCVLLPQLRIGTRNGGIDSDGWWHQSVIAVVHRQLGLTLVFPC